MNTRKLAFGGIIAAVYAAVTLLTASFAYGPVQFRIAEALCILCFFTPSAVWGLTLGCLLANLFSPVSGLDIVIGTLATLVGCLAATKCRKPWLVPVPIILSNAIWVGLELAYVYTPEQFLSGLLLMGSQVAIGEIAVLYVLGLPLLLILQRNSAADMLRSL